jgi:signal recognition particle receptor subunit beta
MINYASREINCKIVYYGPGLGGKTTNLEHVYGKVKPAERMEANLESMQNLYDNMSEYGYDLTQMPFVIQYNKRDLANAAPIEDLQAALNPGWEVEDASKHRVQPDPYHAGQNLVEQLPGGEWVEKAPYFEAIAVNGDGVFDTLKAVSKLVLKALA